MVEPTARAVQQHFDGIADAYYNLVDRVWYEYGYCHKKEVAFLRMSLRTRPRLAIDAGCGPGRNTVVLASLASRVVAVDISRTMLKVARKRVTPDLPAVSDFVQADVQQLPFRERSADLIVNYEVLEHLPDGNRAILAALKEFRRVLLPRGRLITEIPLTLQGRMTVLARPSFKEIDPETKARYYLSTPLSVHNTCSDGEMDTLLQLSGFTPYDKTYVRVVPGRVVERFPSFGKIDEILERIPLIRRLAREAIWIAETP